jgi:hypothetical protein
LPDLHRRGGARLRHEHGAVAPDRDGRSVGRKGDCRVNNEAAGRDRLAMTIVLKRTIAGIAGGPVRQRHLKEAIALDGQILVVSGLLQVAMRENPSGGDSAHTGADLPAERKLGLLQGLGTWLARVLAQQVFEHRARALEAACGHVGHSGRESVT